MGKLRVFPIGMVSALWLIFGSAVSAVDRPGHSTTTHSCDHIRGVPNELRSSDYMQHTGLSTFYQKYTEAYGIPVVGSVNVSDAALKRACYVLRFLLADHSRVRQSLYARSGRVAVIGIEEETTDIPEHRALSKHWNTRARGLGATEQFLVSTVGEENLLCGKTDRWWDEDIGLHEFLHGVHLLGAKLVLEGWQQRLENSYEAANISGRWNNTYSMSHINEYFVEGAQSFFNSNPYYEHGNGVHGPINTQAKLKVYDPDLFQLVRQVFPCNNTYLKRCKHTREEELSQPLKLDCDLRKKSVTRNENDEHNMTQAQGTSTASTMNDEINMTQAQGISTASTMTDEINMTQAHDRRGRSTQILMLPHSKGTTLVLHCLLQTLTVMTQIMGLTHYFS